MHLKYFLLIIITCSIFACQKEDDVIDNYSEECAQCGEYEEEFALITHEILNDSIVYDTLPVIATLDSGIYCIGDLAFEIDLEEIGSFNYITIEEDTISPGETIFLETIDSLLLNLMTINGSCEFLLETNE